ncbi:MAG: sugar ABC transporter substrate-binding protein [Geminicoccaceae bacterium]|nr:sugar ABC transporter substrate-binding protein [Geminicoccaceae bacterium]MDW8371400.1 sugar ABC transporter substrate-binding protein [Geminicoccaceae bacterium]
MTRPSRSSALGLVFAASALLLGVTPAAGPAAAQSGPTIYVIGGKPDDPFWSKVKKGADDAGLVVAARGGKVIWLGPQTYDNLGPDAANLIRTALGQKPNAIVGPNWVPEAMDDAFKAVTATKVPLVIYNSGGIEKAKELGALNYVGSDEYLAGLAGGRYFGKAGAKKVLCVNTLPGLTNTEARCRGVIEGIAEAGGGASQLPLPSTTFGDPTAVTEAIKAAILRDPAVDGVITIGAGDATSAATAIQQAGAQGRVRLGCFDLDQPVLERIKAGTQLFAIDQQPYFQGYLAVSLLFAKVSFGLDLPTRPILTGPGIVDAANIDATLAGVRAGAR